MADLACRELYVMNREQARQQLLKTYQETGSIRRTARQWHTSPQVGRKWRRRCQAQGKEGLADHSRRPHTSPRRTSPEREQQALQARQETGYGPLRLALHLKNQGCAVPAGTIRHILERHGASRKPRQQRKALYPAHWAWRTKAPFTLVQMDTKDIHDKRALGTRLCHHLVMHHLPRYQWTACEARSRLRFLAYSHHLTQDNGFAFALLCLLWIRGHGIQGPVQFQTDCGTEFGGDNPDHVATLSQRFRAPLDGVLCRYPMGRKQYNGRVERSHRADDEEFYLPYLLCPENQDPFLRIAARWTYFYNVLRPHLSYDMHQSPPLDALRGLDYNGPDSIALFPPFLLDPISTDLLLACDPEVGNDLLAQYNLTFPLTRYIVRKVVVRGFAPDRSPALSFPTSG